MLVLPESRILEVHAYIVLLPSCGLKVQGVFEAGGFPSLASAKWAN